MGAESEEDTLNVSSPCERPASETPAFGVSNALETTLVSDSNCSTLSSPIPNRTTSKFAVLDVLANPTSVTGENSSPGDSISPGIYRGVYRRCNAFSPLTMVSPIGGGTGGTVGVTILNAGASALEVPVLLSKYNELELASGL